MWIMQCDKCKKQSEPQEMAFVGFGTEWVSFSITAGYSTKRTYILCDQCQEALNIPKEQPEPTIADNLMDILSDMARDAAREVIEQ